MALLAARKLALPVVVMSSKSFRAGYEKAQHTQEHTGWPTQQAPEEKTIVEFLSTAIEMVSSDLATGDDCDYEIRWIAGLFTGWLRRQD